MAEASPPAVTAPGPEVTLPLFVPLAAGPRLPVLMEIAAWAVAAKKNGRAAREIRRVRLNRDTGCSLGIRNRRAPLQGRNRSLRWRLHCARRDASIAERI